MRLFRRIKQMLLFTTEAQRTLRKGFAFNLCVLRATVVTKNPRQQAQIIKKSVQKSAQKGFTLLEMLAAIAIFSIVSLSAWQIFQGVMAAHEMILAKNERLRQLQYTLLLIDQDLQQIADRGTRLDKGITRQSLFSDSQMLDSDDQGLSLVRYGWHNPEQRLPRAELQRVFYRLKDNQLQRQYHHVLDPASINVEPVTQILLSDINALKFRFFIKGRWLEALPAGAALPEGIAIEFDMKDVGRIERRYLLPSPWQSAS